MNALAKKSALAPAAVGSTETPSVSQLMAAVLRARDEHTPPPQHATEASRRVERYKHALEELVIAKDSDSVDGCISQLLLLSTRIGEDVLHDGGKEEVIEAVERRNERLQEVVFRLVRLLQLDPAEVGAEMYLSLDVLELDGHTPSWVREARETAA